MTWLVGQKEGVALPGLAPRAVLAASPGTTVLVHAADGPVRVRILGSRIRLTAQPARQARLAVRALILPRPAARRCAIGSRAPSKPPSTRPCARPTTCR